MSTPKPITSLADLTKLTKATLSGGLESQEYFYKATEVEALVAYLTPAPAPLLADVLRLIDEAVATSKRTEDYAAAATNLERTLRDTIRPAVAAWQAPAPPTDAFLQNLYDLLAAQRQADRASKTSENPDAVFDALEATARVERTAGAALPGLLMRLAAAEAPLAVIKEHLKALENTEVEPRERHTAEGERSALEWVVSLFEKGGQQDA